MYEFDFDAIHRAQLELRGNRLREQGMEKYGFSLNAFDYPNNGLQGTLGEYERNMDRLHRMLHEDIANYADAVTKLGAKNQKFVEDQTNEMFQSYDEENQKFDFEDKILFGGVANILYLLGYSANPKWISEDRKMALFSLVERLTLASEQRESGRRWRLVGQLAGALVGLLLLLLFDAIIRVFGSRAIDIQ